MPGIYLRSPTEPITPGNIPYAENDKAIVRGITRGFVDPSNSICYSGDGTMNTSTVLRDLVYGGSTFSPDGVLGSSSSAPALSGGLFQAANATSAGGARLPLPASFILPSTCKRALVGFSCKLPLSGYGNTGTTYMGVLDVATSSAPANNQYIFGFRVIDGTITSADKSLAFDGTNISVGNPADYIAAVCNGQLHQVFLFVDSRADKRIATLFIDGVVFATVAAGWTSVNTNITTPASVNAYALGASASYSPPSASAIRAGNAKFGRFQVHDLTGTEIDPLTIVQADYQIARRFLT